MLALGCRGGSHRYFNGCLLPSTPRRKLGSAQHLRTHQQQLGMHNGTGVCGRALGAAESAAATQQDPHAHFDLPLAIALAAVAFEAYLEPSGAEEQYQEVLLNDTFVTYTDRDFLLSTFAGLLQLTVHSAKGLKAVNITGGSDPYVVATLGDSSATTAVKWGELDPEWQETHTLYVTNTDKDVLRLRVIDKNKLMADVELGVVMVAVADLLNGEGQQLELRLRGGNAQGSITVSGRFLPFSEGLLQAATTNDMQLPPAPESLAVLEDQLQAAVVVQETVAATVAEQAEEVKQAIAPAVEKATEAAKQAQEAAKQAKAAADSLKPAAQAAAGKAAEVLKPAADKAAAALSSAAEAAVAATVAVAVSKSMADSDNEGDGEGHSAPALGKVVEGAKEHAVQSLSGALDDLEGRLSGSGLSKQAQAVAHAKSGVVGAVSEAAEGIKTFVQEEGLSEVPVSDLAAIISRITARRATAAATNDATTPEGAAAAVATAAAAAAASAASSLPALTPEAMPGAWKALASVAGKMVEDVFKPVAFVENKTTDTQVWLQVSRELREVVLAFRGTEQVKWKDFVSDINLIPQTLDVERTKGMDLGIGNIPLPFATFKKNKETMVHSGFLSAYDSVKVKVLRLVDQLTADASPERPWKVFVTGHSLGGALATLAAYDLTARRGAAASSRQVEMYTYGAPRVGNKAFADAFNERLQGKSWRITNKADIVPSIPRLMGYAHVRTGVRLDSGGVLSFEDGSKDVLGEGREVAEVVMDLASQALEVAQGNKALEDVMDAIQEHEMAILNALVDGSALGQHMEDFYLATLKEAVLAADPALAGKVQQALETAAAKAAPAASTAAAH